MNTDSLDHIRQVRKEAELLCNSEQVHQALDEMAVEIKKHLEDTNPLCLCVMTGGVVTTGHLLTRLDFPLQLDYIHATRYQGGTQGKDLEWVKKPAFSLIDRTILLIDDILDEGLTMGILSEYCEQAGAKEILTAVLVEKDRERAPGGLEKATFTGLYIPDRYVFGYGLDYHGYLRNADGIYAVKGL
ncbi:MAG: hypoxanthine-guanine phosphoribosyltransferase [Pseudomonadota bacterium]